MSMKVSGGGYGYGNGYEDKVQRRQDEDKPDKITANTDRTDREIAKLREEKSRLEQQIRMAGEESDAERLRQQLKQVERELRQKDNDGYRRSHVDIMV